MPKLLHLDPNDYLIDTFRLGKLVYESGFRPKHAISIWRGGTPVGLGVDTFFRCHGVSINHSTVATASYTGLGERGQVMIKNLEHLVNVVCPEDRLLIIDDVYETGTTIQELVELLRKTARANTPHDIRVAVVHRKPEKMSYAELPIYALRDIDKDVWIDYPHELSDLVDDSDPLDQRIRDKNEMVWRLLRGEISESSKTSSSSSVSSVPSGSYLYVNANELLLDAVRLGLMVCRDTATWCPDFLIALWPGGVLAGLPVHEVYKYHLRKTDPTRKVPDHISVNTAPTRHSYRNEILGLQYLQDRICKDHNILIIDTTFRGAGRVVNDVVMRLKELLRRNLNHKRIRVASIYYNPNDHSTWTVRPDIPRPDYFVREVSQEVVYPHSVHKLPYAVRDLKRLNPTLWDVLYSCG